MARLSKWRLSDELEGIPTLAGPPYLIVVYPKFTIVMVTIVQVYTSPHTGIDSVTLPSASLSRL